MGQELCAKSLQPGCSCYHRSKGGETHSSRRSQPVTMEAEFQLTDLKEASSCMTSFHPRGVQGAGARKFESKRPRSNSDSFQEEDLRQGFQWRNSLPFGAASSYLNLEKLGEGSYATVYKGISRINGQLVALKVISMNAEEGVPFTAIREASLLKGLKHANIVLLHDIIHTKETLTFVFEYMLFMFQLLRGLAYIHHQHVLHRDLKPQNLLISHLGELKLADFGLARAKSIPSQTYSSEVVTLWYRPPDALLGATEYSSELDIWGAGCIFIEMFQGQPLFPGVSNILEQLEKIWEVLGVPTEDTWPGVTKLPNYNPEWFPLSKPQSLQIVWNRLGRVPEAEDLASQMLKGFPRDRVSAQEALGHDYFSALPSQLSQLPDEESLFTVSGVRLKPEMCDLLASYQKGHHPAWFSKCW
ncbi:cyclin dependent kinase 15, transcript variant X2 [Ictidomys tridecemlineatus]|uniref:cyclin-dependent kinase 15 isoform X4 n=1 Tax=Ictidomys tridecemlineatus TaxID=43179 RepID=UPI000B53DE22|nr:cyclin-dependent kinase 15 isoform X4 [Ictidomys tridecemlineatus]KAG3275006.1 cyclin dependent kinase 15, transcript variant X2 [Ictidomys tridecemlineatus]